LKRLLFVLELPEDEVRYTEDETMDRKEGIVGHFEAFFDLHKGRFQGGKAPLVTARMEENPEDETKV
jgi:hypothetical protein